ncbi:MAG: hypothetical protein KBD56_09160 [Candidatus Eisenbacteria bacterium]|nr:hypothetical protein [Candidatus Eisenbacteria bacterium]
MESAAAGTQATPSRPATSLYAQPADGLRAVRDDYHYWTGKLTETSWQFCFALIGANWAVFGSVRGILDNFFSKSSLFLVVLSLLVGLLGAKVMSECHRTRADYAAADPKRWQEECNASFGRKSDPWPFTKAIENIGRIMREAKTWLPIAGGVLFLLGLLLG